MKSKIIVIFALLGLVFISGCVGHTDEETICIRELQNNYADIEYWNCQAVEKAGDIKCYCSYGWTPNDAYNFSTRFIINWNDLK